MHIFKTFMKKSKLCIYWADIYLTILDTATELGAGTPDHVLVHGGGHCTGLDAIGMSIGMYLKFALDKIAQQL